MKYTFRLYFKLYLSLTQILSNLILMIKSVSNQMAAFLTVLYKFSLQEKVK